MEPDELEDAFLSFIKADDPAEWASLRAKFMASEDYDPCAGDLRKLNELIERGNYPEARVMAGRVYARYFLSPSFHLCLSAIFKWLGDEEEVRAEDETFGWLVRAIALSGDGSAEHRFLAINIMDVIDVLHLWLHKQIASHRQLAMFLANGNRLFHEFECDDGTKLYFETGMPMCGACTHKLPECDERPVVH
jgi:hypothetical protein